MPRQIHEYRIPELRPVEFVKNVIEQVYYNFWTVPLFVRLGHIQLRVSLPCVSARPRLPLHLVNEP